MFQFLLFAAAAGAAPAAAPAWSPTPGTVDFDAQCMVVMGQVANQAPDADKANLNAASMFYFGRVDAALSGNALKQRLRDVGKKVEGAEAQPMVRACGQFMAERGLAMATMGKELEAEEKAGK